MDEFENVSRIKCIENKNVWMCDIASYGDEKTPVGATKHIIGINEIEFEGGLTSVYHKNKYNMVKTTYAVDDHAKCVVSEGNTPNEKNLVCSNILVRTFVPELHRREAGPKGVIGLPPEARFPSPLGEGESGLEFEFPRGIGAESERRGGVVRKKWELDKGLKHFKTERERERHKQEEEGEKK